MGCCVDSVPLEYTAMWLDDGMDAEVDGRQQSGAKTELSIRLTYARKQSTTQRQRSSKGAQL